MRAYSKSIAIRSVGTAKTKLAVMTPTSSFESFHGFTSAAMTLGKGPNQRAAISGAAASGQTKSDINFYQSCTKTVVLRASVTSLLNSSVRRVKFISTRGVFRFPQGSTVKAASISSA